MEIYATDFDVEVKGDESPLTQADKNANDVINRYLETTGIPIISEENREIPFSERGDWEECWIVDPLDGTKEFVKRNGEFTVNIALVRNGDPVIGVIYVPVSKVLYFTNESGTASYKTEISDVSLVNDALITSSTPLRPLNSWDSPVKVVGSRSHLNDDTKNFIAGLEEEHQVEIVSKGSSLKFCLVAEGAAHVYPRYAPTMEWDTAAGQAICEAVGVAVVKVPEMTPLRYNKENLLNPYFQVSRSNA